MNRILIVDDESHVLFALKRALRQHFGEGLEVETEVDAFAALEKCRATSYDAVISDLRMPAMDGISLLALVSAVQPQCARLILTGSADLETAQRAIQDAGVFRYLTKPWVTTELVAHVRAALARAPQPALRQV